MKPNETSAGCQQTRPKAPVRMALPSPPPPSLAGSLTKRDLAVAADVRTANRDTVRTTLEALLPDQRAHLGILLRRRAA